MSTTVRNVTGSRRKPLAVFGTGLFIIVAIWASRFPLFPTPATTTADDPKPTAATAKAVAAAEAFLGGLDAKLRDKVAFDFDSTKKPNWSNLPTTFVPRNGVRLGDVTMAQRALAMQVVAAVCSKDGYQKMLDIMDGDQQLAMGQGGGRGGPGGGPGGGPPGGGPGGQGGPPGGRPGGPPGGGRGGPGGGSMFGTDNYYLAIFGKPSATQPWMVQFGGHHLGLNITVIGKHFVLTPTHTGAQPSLFKRDGKDVRPLGLENDSAFKLVNALDAKQRPQAVVSDRPQGELLLGPGRDGRKPPDPQGIKGSALTADQQAMLLDVIGAWVNIAEPDAAAARLAEIKTQIGNTYFAWKGPTEKGRAAYFRVQGPTIVIEYAPQGSADHIHTVVRNPKDDYGAALMKQ
jgi:hypothetical protein